MNRLPAVRHPALLIAASLALLAVETSLAQPASDRGKHEFQNSCAVCHGADGRELARHQGFMSRDEILAQWKAVGVEL